MKRHHLLRIAAVLSSTTLVAIYIGCRAARSDSGQSDSLSGTSSKDLTPPPEVFSGSKSELIVPATRPEVFSGSKSAEIIPRATAPSQSATPPKQQPK